MRKNKLKRVGIFAKLFCWTLALFLIAVGFVFPPLWLFALILIGASVGYRAYGYCPLCDGYLEVTKKRGGTICKCCRSPLKIRNRTLTPL